MTTNLDHLAAETRTAAAKAAAQYARLQLGASSNYLGNADLWNGFEDGTAAFWLGEYRWLRYQPSHEQIGTDLSAEKWHYDRERATFMEPLGKKAVDRYAWTERVELHNTDTPAIWPQVTRSLPLLLELARPAT